MAVSNNKESYVEDTPSFWQNRTGDSTITWKKWSDFFFILLDILLVIAKKNMDIENLLKSKERHKDTNENFVITKHNWWWKRATEKCKTREEYVNKKDFTTKKTS